ncbi:4-diphosphocytidyl-2-C-methyl-D-erythritol kinase [Roseovarius lutimaris]|uniref:4-diphosphocytidyl-2-C-methyl-D-erythritol kinase n=1 Tax=Roseovarius lutimaris TaxID=1005928 RepID=A0A1I4ZRA8_9RHOB|nr:4-(cytidine 5'-diphospho)-2-C-methyl-D-erythritol kinase [Roseovarius lutimaris]SFN52688.1 4-diphosphocytidyl-2-C-methyl-D-erythritol kinase [Roseovarius lutimaris]
MTAVKAHAPAKINLTLHVTGRRSDGYHLLDSLVVFADFGDLITVRPATVSRLAVTGPMAAGVPVDADNLVLKAAALIDVTADITLEKHLPAAAGIGGGSSDAAATLRALCDMTGVAMPRDVLVLGADVPVCLAPRAARMRGIGEDVTPLAGVPSLYAVLVKPPVAVATPGIFAGLTQRENPAMSDPLPVWADAAAFMCWLGEQRNDLQGPAIAAGPIIAEVLEALLDTPGCQLARMSGSGATCFGLYDRAESAAAAAGRLAQDRPGWWAKATRLNAA